MIMVATALPTPIPTCVPVESPISGAPVDMEDDLVGLEVDGALVQRETSVSCQATTNVGAMKVRTCGRNVFVTSSNTT